MWYITEKQADAIIAALVADSEWSTVTNKSVYLNKAMLGLNNLYFPSSTKEDEDQTNSFPRVACDGNNYSTIVLELEEVDGKSGYYDYEVAQAILAWYYSDGFDNDSAREQATVKVSRGSRSVDFGSISGEDKLASANKIPIDVYQLVSNWLRG